jgi:hypothetical protein
MADMGIGFLGNPGTVFKRKFRWTFELQGTVAGNIPPMFVKKSKRPKVGTDDKKIDFLNGTTWIPSKYTPEELSVTYYDVGYSASAGGVNADGNQVVRGVAALYSYIATLYDIQDPKRMNQSSAPAGYCAKYGILNMLDGCGSVIETFTYNQPWPKSIDFGDLDYGSSDECNIELTMRYQSFKYTAGVCAVQPKNVKCVGCAPSI